MTVPALSVSKAPPAPTDPVFAAWAAEGLVWLPEHGMGRLQVEEAPYDAAYFAKYEAYARTQLGHALNGARLALVDRHHGGGQLVDVGIGCGAFVEARGGQTWGFDVNPEGVRWLMERGHWRDPYAGPVDAVSLWDALEHIPEPVALLSNVRRWLFVSLPIVPGEGPPPRDWKHLRRDEHCWYWTRAGFVRWMAAHGFALAEESDVETELGREDILSFAFRRRG